MPSNLKTVRWAYLIVTLFAMPLAVTVLVILVRFMLWAITGDGTWAGYTPWEDR